MVKMKTKAPIFNNSRSITKKLRQDLDYKAVTNNMHNYNTKIKMLTKICKNEFFIQS